MITDFKVFRYDRNRFGGGLLLFVNDKMQSRFLSKYFIFFETDIMAIELHQNKSKWLFWCAYKPPNQNDWVFVEPISVIMNKYSAQYEHIVIFGDFIMSIENSHFQDLMQIYDLSPLIKEPTCFLSHNPSCLLTFKQKVMFKLNRSFETGLSDHHKLISVVMKCGIFRGHLGKKFTNLTKILTWNILILH